MNETRLVSIINSTIRLESEYSEKYREEIALTSSEDISVLSLDELEEIEYKLFG